jgi:hypothetical protein
MVLFGFDFICCVKYSDNFNLLIFDTISKYLGYLIREGSRIKNEIRGQVACFTILHSIIDGIGLMRIGTD